MLLNPDLILKELADYQRRKARTTDIEQEARALETRRQKTAERARRLAELYLGQAIDKEHFQTEHRRLKDESDEIGREIEKLRGLAMTQEEILVRARSLQSLYALYETRLKIASPMIKRAILCKFIKSIIVRGEDLELEVMLPPAAQLCGTTVSTAVPQSDAFEGGQTRRVSFPTGFGSHSFRNTIPQPSTTVVKSSLNAVSRPELSIFLNAQLVPIGEVLRNHGLHKNLGKYATKRLAA